MYIPPISKLNSFDFLFFTEVCNTIRKRITSWLHERHTFQEWCSELSSRRHSSPLFTIFWKNIHINIKTGEINFNVHAGLSYIIHQLNYNQANTLTTSKIFFLHYLPTHVKFWPRFLGKFLTSKILESWWDLEKILLRFRVSNIIAWSQQSW